MRDGITLLVNPTAGRGRVLEHWPHLPAILGARAEVEVIVSRAIEELDAAARNAAARGRTIVVAGGDGTVNRVLNALNGCHARLGVLPVGCGNDFARALGLPADPLGAAARIAGGGGTPLDLVSVNGHLFSTVGGVGLVADASALVARLGRHQRVGRRVLQVLGRRVYLVAAAAQIALRRRITTRLAVEGSGSEGGWRWAGACHALLVANLPWLGAGLRLPVQSSSADGECEICVVLEDRRVRLVQNLRCLETRRPIREGALLVFRASRASIVCEESRAFAGDGEVLESAREFSIEVRPGAVRVIV
jgi:YegS/Rv2252/BmrU family lipid kinase